MEILPLRERRKDPNTIPFLQTHQRDKSFDVVSISKIVSARVAGERVEADRKVVRKKSGGGSGGTYFPVRGGFCVTKLTAKGGERLHPSVSDRRLWWSPWQLARLLAPSSSSLLFSLPKSNLLSYLCTYEISCSS